MPVYISPVGLNLIYCLPIVQTFMISISVPRADETK